MYGYPLGRSDQLPLQFKSIKVKATLFTIYIYMYIYVCTETIKCLETHHVRLLKQSNQYSRGLIGDSVEAKISIDGNRNYSRGIIIEYGN